MGEGYVVSYLFLLDFKQNDKWKEARPNGLGVGNKFTLPLKAKDRINAVFDIQSAP